MPCRRNRRVFALPLVAVVAVVLGGCGGGGGGGGTRDATNGTVDVGAYDIHFDVKTIDAKPGNLTVNLHERGQLPHTFTIAAKNFEIKVNSSKTNASGTVNLPAGNYTFICSTPGHAALMHGTVVVK